MEQRKNDCLEHSMWTMHSSPFQLRTSTTVNNMGLQQQILNNMGLQQQIQPLKQTAMQEHRKQVTTSISALTRKPFSLDQKQKRHDPIGKFWLSMSFSLVFSNSALTLSRFHLFELFFLSRPYLNSQFTKFRHYCSEAVWKSLKSYFFKEDLRSATLNRFFHLSLSV